MSSNKPITNYAERNPRQLEPHYTAHVIAMMREDLHSKSDIAAELAWRDQRLQEATNRALVAEQELDAVRSKLFALDLRDRNHVSMIQGYQKEMQQLRSLLVAPTIQQAHDMGAKGASPTEAERLLFEAWMAGHCWKVSGDWSGATYVHKSEKGTGNLHGPTVFTRGLWAAWRDRAALAQKGGVA